MWRVDGPSLVAVPVLLSVLAQSPQSVTASQSGPAVPVAVTLSCKSRDNAQTSTEYYVDRMSH
jgi:hypothetical protein